MSVLARLVARASGTATPGLRPVLASRFETGSEAVLGGAFAVQEPQANTVEGHAAAAAIQQPVAPPSETAQSAPAAIEAQAKRRSNPPEPPPFPSPKRAAASEPSLSVALSTDAPLVPPLSPAPLLEEDPIGSAEIAADPLSEPSPAPPLNAPQVPRPQGHAHPLPQPLLPPDPQARIEPAAPAAAVPTLSNPSPAAQAVQSQAPDITIHIGRLDLRSDAPKPAKLREPAKSKPASAGLSDYLRGRAS